MKEAPKFVIGIFIEGFMVMLPFLISYILLGGLFDALMALTQPLIDVLPYGIFPDAWTHHFAAAAALVAIFFLAGLAARTAMGRRLGIWIEERVLSRFAPYSLLRSFSRRIADRDTSGELQPAFLESNPGVRQLVFIVENPAEGDLTVFLPLAPTPGIGTLQLVRRDKVQFLDASFLDAAGSLFNWGEGMGALLKSHGQPGGPPAALDE